MPLEGVKLTELPTHRDERGSLVFAQQTDHIGFEVKRIFYLFGMGAETKRGGHAHILCHQALISISGSSTVTIRTAGATERILLESPNQVLHVPPGHWVDLNGFSEDAILLVLASHLYDEHDYVRSWSDFITRFPH
jgi:dTDP-4-dehydrorhamnose 3,5-epimerase-like enzyme